MNKIWKKKSYILSGVWQKAEPNAGLLKNSLLDSLLKQRHAVAGSGNQDETQKN